ncbi:MAG: hypothetical protein JST75_17735 [Bacteroidetes bacterium]|nr:hypothetical protein [Bacteroidota bacterium]
MKITTFLKPLITVFIVTALISTGCKKDNSSSNNNGGGTDDSTAGTMSGSSAIADNAYYDVLQTALEGGSDNNIAYMASQASRGTVETNGVHNGVSVNGVTSLTCAIYTMSPADNTTFPKTLVVDFGSGCTSADGVTRKGKITYTISGKVLNPGTTITATFQNYSVFDYQLEGTYSITNTSTINGISFTTKVTGGKITFPNTYWYTYSGDKTIKMTAGMSTPSDPTDDVYSIEGSNSFASAAGNTLDVTITTILSKAYTCHNIGSGVISFTYNKKINGTLDFGSGTCDNQATITVGNWVKQVTLN